MTDMIYALDDMVLTSKVVRGKISRAWRQICHSRKDRHNTSRRAHRRDRRALRVTLACGARFDPKHLTGRDIS